MIFRFAFVFKGNEIRLPAKICLAVKLAREDMERRISFTKVAFGVNESDDAPVHKKDMFRAWQLIGLFGWAYRIIVQGLQSLGYVTRLGEK